MIRPTPEVIQTTNDAGIRPHARRTLNEGRRRLKQWHIVHVPGWLAARSEIIYIRTYDMMNHY